MSELAITVPLVAHGTIPQVGQAISVTICLDGPGRLCIRFSGQGDSSRTRFPQAVTPARRDNLWRHTCGELFIAARNGSAYREFNFSPSGEWAAYDFTDYRQRCPELVGQAMPMPVIGFHQDAIGWQLEVGLVPELLDRYVLDQAEIGLSAIVEDVDGRLGYWALAHPGERPDFHDRRGFILHGSDIPRLGAK